MANSESRIGRIVSNRSPSLTRFFSVFIAWMKPLGLFAGGLYLFGFGLFGLNRFGMVDALIPAERVGYLILGVAFLSWFILSMFRLWKVIRSY